MPIAQVPAGKISDFIHEHYEVYEWKHAIAILKQDYPQEWQDILEVLTHFRLRRSAISVGGGRKSDVAGELDTAFYRRGWKETEFRTRVVVDTRSMDSPTHKVDCYKNEVALEVEWNNKDPFYDRDLNNFRLLFDLRTVSVGVIVTRSDELQEIFASLGRGSSYGSSTTHMGKLLGRVEGGGGGGCPVLVFGITRSLYEEDL